MRVILLLLMLSSGLVQATDDLKQQIYPCALENAARKIVFKEGTLMVCYFGGDPINKPDGWVSVVGVSFHRLAPGAKNSPEFLAQADEFGLGVDYRFLDGKLEIASYFDTYPDFKAVQFFVDTIDLNQIPARHERKLVYKPARISTEEVARAALLLKIGETKYRKLYQPQYGYGMLYEQMFKLRDYAFVDPLNMSRELKKMEDAWWNDGEVAEVFDSIQRDVAMLLEIQKINGVTH